MRHRPRWRENGWRRKPGSARWVENADAEYDAARTVCEVWVVRDSFGIASGSQHVPASVRKLRFAFSTFVSSRSGAKPGSPAVPGNFRTSARRAGNSFQCLISPFSSPVYRS